jgi:hypothetical protein
MVKRRQRWRQLHEGVRLQIEKKNRLYVSKANKGRDADQPNTKRNHANDPLEVPIGPITRVRAKKLKEALNGLVQNIWSKMDLERLGTFKEHEGQPLIHLVQVQEEPNSRGTRG